MLKHTIKYLKEKLESTNNKIKKLIKNREEYDGLKAKYEEGKRYIDAYKENVEAKDLLIGNNIVVFIKATIASAFIGAISFLLAAPLYLLFLPLIGAIVYYVPKSIITINKNNKNLKEIKDSLTLFGEKELEDINIEDFEENLIRDTKYKISMNETLISWFSNDRSIILSLLHIVCVLPEDEIADALIHYEEPINSNFLNRALEEEWYGYLEEMNNIPISEVHLEGSSISEECLKEATQKFHIEPTSLKEKITPKKGDRVKKLINYEK